MYGKVEYDPLLNQFKCEICNKWVTNLAYHIRIHKTSAAKYRKKFGLLTREKLVSKETSDLRKKIFIEKIGKERLKPKDGYIRPIPKKGRYMSAEEIRRKTKRFVEMNKKRARIRKISIKKVVKSLDK